MNASTAVYSLINSDYYYYYYYYYYWEHCPQSRGFSSGKFSKHDVSKALFCRTSSKRTQYRISNIHCNTWPPETITLWLVNSTETVRTLLQSTKVNKISCYIWEGKANITLCGVFNNRTISLYWVSASCCACNNEWVQQSFVCNNVSACFKQKHVVIHVFNKARWNIVANEGLL
jgi:hypothetical protein